MGSLELRPGLKFTSTMVLWTSKQVQPKTFVLSLSVCSLSRSESLSKIPFLRSDQSKKCSSLSLCVCMSAFLRCCSLFQKVAGSSRNEQKAKNCFCKKKIAHEFISRTSQMMLDFDVFKVYFLLNVLLILINIKQTVIIFFGSKLR